jgi:hypothetical protein
MQLNGDQILRVFHRYNFTLSSNLDWARLFDAVRRDPTPEAVDLVSIIEIILFKTDADCQKTLFFLSPMLLLY